MIKTKFSLTAILATTALTTGALFAIPAESCPLHQAKDGGLLKNFPSLNFNQLNPLQIGMLGVGSAAVVATAGWLVAKKVKGTTDTLTSPSDEVFNETPFPIHVPPKALETTTLVVEEEEVSVEQPTSIG